MEQKLIQRATIRFPRAVSLNETEDVLKFVAKKLPANVNWTSQYYKNIFHTPERKFLTESGSVSLTAMITSLKTPFAVDTFETLRFDRDSSRIEGLRATLIPGYDLISEYRSEAVQLWDNVRKQTKAYFSSH
ncbi:MAG: hypothetical protein AABX17_00720 [Nanoarchaeota archaeon]